jgi:hypothetical protein
VGLELAEIACVPWASNVFLQSLASRVPRSMEMQKESEQYPNKVNERRMEDNWSATVV